MNDTVLASKYSQALCNNLPNEELIPTIQSTLNTCQYINFERRVYDYLVSPLTSIDQKKAMAAKIITKLGGNKKTGTFSK